MRKLAHVLQRPQRGIDSPPAIAVGTGDYAAMQGNQDMTFDSEQVAANAPRTTAAGLDAWLSGVHADAPQVEAMQVGDVQIDDGMPELAEVPEPIAGLAQPEAIEPIEVGPVNAAEALALALATGTFSSPRKLVGPDGAELVVDPEQNAYHFESTSLKPLAVLLEQPASAWTPIYSEALKAARVANPAQPLGRLRWYAGLIATPGILGRKLIRSERYKLSRWPETEREFPKHFRLAKEMVKDFATVDAIVAASGMSHEEVVDYFNACFADGRLEAPPRVQENDASPQGSRRERLMARLNKPLFAR
jgi:hypothetical protein